MDFWTPPRFLIDLLLDTNLGNYFFVSGAQHIIFISPQNAGNGDPKVLKSGWPWEIPGNSGFL